MSSTKVKNGTVIIYRVFDVAEECNLKIAEDILQSGSGELRIQVGSKTKDAVVIRNAPIRWKLKETPNLDPLFSHVEIWATLWDYGTLSFSFHCKVEGTRDWEDWLNISAYTNWDQSFLNSVDQAAKRMAEQVCVLMEKAFIRPSLWSTYEDYMIFFFENISTDGKLKDLLQTEKVTELLLGETKEKLSSETKESILQNSYQYSEDDLTVIDWNTALVVEPSGSREITDIIEFALTHLLEVRFYDQMIDKRLDHIYSSIELKRSKTLSAGFSGISKEANRRYMEFTEFMERMGNSLKVVGDFYLARIFRGAIRRFRISDWENGITRKMNLLAKVSELLQAEINVKRSHLLELIIVLLILFEIISAMWKGMH